MAALIFDFDGTIADSFALAVEVFHHVTGRSEALTAGEIRTLRGHSTREVLKRLGIPWWKVPRLLASGREAIHQRLNEVQPFIGIGPILYDLHNRGHKLYIVSTNNAQSIEHFLEVHDMRQFFEKIYGSVGLFGKPKVLRRIIKDQGLSSNDCIYIGDETRDIHAAQRVGIRSVGVTWGFNNAQAIAGASPDQVVHKPEELLVACA